jgi:isopenicillin-N epimerase
MTVLEYGRGLLPRWLLEPDAIFLNHGSFGATPRAVLDAQSAWRARMEAQPVRFMTRELPLALHASLDRLGTLLGAHAADLAFVDNATSGVNAVLRSIDWQAGDEIVLSRQAYESVQQAARYLVDRHGVRLRQAPVPFPLEHDADIVSAYREVLGPRTRLVIVDHVSSQTALIAPVQSIIALCRDAGCAVLVDGAHAPGMLPLAIESLGADWYTGNCHKWLFAAKGCAFLWTAPARQASTHPLCIAKGYGSGYREEFDWTGTRDPSAWLALDAALEFHRSLGGDALCERNHALAITAAQMLCAAWDVTLPAPPSLFGSMATVPLPPRWPVSIERAKRLHDQLWDEHRIELPVLAHNERLWVRISCQAYNESADYEHLAQAVRAL